MDQQDGIVSGKKACDAFAPGLFSIFERKEREHVGYFLAISAFAAVLLCLVHAAATEDDRMGIRFSGEGVKPRDQS